MVLHQFLQSWIICLGPIEAERVKLSHEMEVNTGTHVQELQRKSSYNQYFLIIGQRTT